MDGWLLVALVVYGLIAFVGGAVFHEWAESQSWYWRVQEWFENKARGR